MARPPKPHVAQILALLDAGQTPVQIIATGLASKRVVYGVLRAHRPIRKRAPRKRTSNKRAMALALARAGVSPRRIAELCQVSRIRVYKFLNEAWQAQ